MAEGSDILAICLHVVFVIVSLLLTKATLAEGSCNEKRNVVGGDYTVCVLVLSGIANCNISSECSLQTSTQLKTMTGGYVFTK